MWFLCLFVLLALASGLSKEEGRRMMHAMRTDPVFRGQLRHLETMFGKINAFRRAAPELGVTFDCAVCGIAVNEIEGLLLENRTQADIAAFLQSDVCALLSGEVRATCDFITAELPQFIALLEAGAPVSSVCVELALCSAPFAPQADPQPIPTFQIDLDAPPAARFAAACNAPSFQVAVQYLQTTVYGLLADGGAYLDSFGLLLNGVYLPVEFAQEIQGCAAALGVTTGFATLVNLGYELSDACTSVVIEAADGTPLHARNLDFWDGYFLTDSMRNASFIAQFQRGGVTQFSTSTIAGFVGVLSGIRPGAFAVTVDTRFSSAGLLFIVDEIIAAMEEKNATLVTFLTREVVQNEMDFTSAVYYLSNTPLIADVYYTVSGVAKGEGVVIARNMTGARYTWWMGANTPLLPNAVMVTNYDINEEQPWFDDRLSPLIVNVAAVQASGVNLRAMMGVLSEKPTLNLQSVQSVLGVAKNGTWFTWTRYCPYPCTQ